MTEIITFTPEATRPERKAVLENQGIPAGEDLPGKLESIYTDALDLLAEVAAPVAILAKIPREDFEVVYDGAGNNEPRTPVGDIFKQADNLALFAVTLGQRVSREIESRFRENDLALGAMLDSAAAAAADRLAQLAEDHYGQAVAAASVLPTSNARVGLGGRVGMGERVGMGGRGSCRAAARREARPPDRSNPRIKRCRNTSVLRYSPGYCGWHISGQKKLFEYLRPDQIGISLRESFLMEPLKSVSGVLIVGPKEIHSFEMTYPCCRRCRTRDCRERLRTLSTK